MIEPTVAQQEFYQRLCQSWGGVKNFSVLPSAVACGRSKVGGTVGWRTYLPTDYVGIDRTLDIILPGQFPFNEPQLWVEPSPFLIWPHAEGDGKLCLWPPGHAPVWVTPSDFAQATIEQFGRLFQLVQSGCDPMRREAEFAQEWMSYWSAPDPTKHNASGEVILLSPPTQKPGRLKAYFLTTPAYDANGETRHSKAIIIADHETSDLDKWARQSGFDRTSNEQASVLVIPLHNAPTAPGAPMSQTAIMEFIDRWSMQPSVARREFEELNADSMERARWVIFSHGKSALTSLRLVPRFALSTARGRQNKKEQAHSRALRKKTGFNIAVATVQRADIGWLHDRDLNPQIRPLQTCHVFVVGTGSLGSMVVESLALAGIGQMTLVDPGILETANIGRHALGARFIGQKKAFCLRARLLADYPHLDITAIDKKIQHDSLHLDDALRQANLVVCTTADPASEQYLMTALRLGRLQSLMLSWSEPHALAGHSVHSPGPPFELEQLFQDGRCVDAATDWPRSPSVPLPGCGTSHIPGAGNRVRLIASMVVEHATDALLGERGTGEHHTWVAASDVVESHGGVRLRPVCQGPTAMLVSLLPTSTDTDGLSTTI